MAYGISVYNGVYENINPQALGGNVFVQKLYLPVGTNTFYEFDNVPSHTYLKLYYLQAGSHSLTLSTVGGKARITVTALSAVSPRESYVFVFTTNTSEPSYGIATTNDVGERIVSTAYPVPKYLGKITLDATPTSEEGLGQGASYKKYIHQKLSSFGSGTDRIILWTLPDQPNDVWFVGTAFVPASVGNFTLEGNFLVPISGGSYVLPEALVFSLSNYTGSSDTYGMRIYGPSSSLLFDSGVEHMLIKEYLNLVYSTAGSSTTSTTLSSINTAIVIPNFYTIEKVPIPGQNASTWSEYLGCVKRVGNTLYTKKMLVYRIIEDSAETLYEESGSQTNITLLVDASTLGAGSGGTVTPPLSGETSVLSGSSSCTYDPAVASNCTTTQTYTIAVSGGNGTALSYSWSITSGTGFSISGSTTSSTVTVIATGSGTLTGNLRCTISQTGSTSINVDYTMSRTHTASGTPLTASISSTNATTTCSYPTSSASSCTTSETFTVSTSGGDGTTKTYSWSFSSNPGGFSFTTGTTGTSVSITLNAGGTATYIATVACQVTQSGNTTTAYYNISHTHTAESTTYTLATGFAETAEAVDSTDGFAQVYLYVERNGTARTVDHTATTIANYNWVTPQSSNVGDLFYVRFTRTSTSGIPTYGDASASTGWLLINTTRSVQVYCQTTDAVLRTASAQYTVDFSSNASTVEGTGTFLLRARAAFSNI